MTSSVVSKSKFLELLESSDCDIDPNEMFVDSQSEHGKLEYIWTVREVQLNLYNRYLLSNPTKYKPVQEDDEI
jgi:hypothetical protein